jgi:DNA-binding MarR family transcriptional regulator
VDFSLLMLLLAYASATPKQVAQALAVPPPKVTGLVGALVERGLVARRRNATDGRAQDLLLTARCREVATRAHRLSLTMESAMLQALSPRPSRRCSANCWASWRGPENGDGPGAGPSRSGANGGGD